MSTRGNPSVKSKKAKGAEGLNDGEREDIDVSVEALVMSEDDGDDGKAAVRLHVVVKEPPKLSKASSERWEDVVIWREAWTSYFEEVKRSDVARAVVEAQVLKRWNLMLSGGPDNVPLKEHELGRLPALEFMMLLEDYLRPLAKKAGVEGQEMLLKLKGKATLTVAMGKEESYPGWQKVTVEIRNSLEKVGLIPNWREVEDNAELANAFLDIFGDVHFRNKLRNKAKANGAASNAYKLWRLANQMIYDSGVAENTLSEGHVILLHTLVQRGGRREAPPSGAKAAKKEAVASGDGKGNGQIQKCWSCGTAEKDHDWRACKRREDLSDTEKAAGEAARMAAGKKK